VADYRHARRYGLDPAVFARQIQQESSFNPNARSPAGALGIAQITPATAREWGVNPLDPMAALDAAARNMARYVKQYGSYRDALVAYNAGPGRVGKPLLPETRSYVSAILGGANPPATVAGTTRTTTTPSVDNSAQRAALIGRFLSDKNPDVLGFALGVRALNDTGQTQPGGPAPVSSGYVDPFGASLKGPGRIDEGVDPTIHGPIRAIGNAKVVAIQHNFYKGQPYIVYQLSDGPHAGKYVYVSELVTPTVRPGQTVRAGDVIATGHGPIETGWAGGPKGSYLPLANRAQGGTYTEGAVTGPGRSFAQLLRSLGVRATP
jgi:murein DD-endopeptidase MepM/ murein hydrolase activator NlpD